jgi:hypothetical protein
MQHIVVDELEDGNKMANCAHSLYFYPQMKVDLKSWKKQNGSLGLTRLMISMLLFSRGEGLSLILFVRRVRN